MARFVTDTSVPFRYRSSLVRFGQLLIETINNFGHMRNKFLKWMSRCFRYTIQIETIGKYTFHLDTWIWPIYCICDYLCFYASSFNSASIYCIYERDESNISNFNQFDRQLNEISYIWRGNCLFVRQRWYYTYVFDRYWHNSNDS